MKYQIFIYILLIIGAIYLFGMCVDCNRTIYDDNNTTHASYNINHYIDTVCGHIILTTVCNDIHNNVSVSTLEIDNFSKIDNN